MEKIKLKRFDGEVKKFSKPLAKVLVKTKRYKYLRTPKSEQPEIEKKENNENKANKNEKKK